MMNYIIQELKAFPITIGNLTIYLSGYQLSGSSTLKESGTADGSTILSGCWGQGVRLKLKGRLAPDCTPDQMIQALIENMLIPQTVSLGKLLFNNAMLSGYTLTDQQDTPELQLIFYCPEHPVQNQIEEEEEEENSL